MSVKKISEAILGVGVDDTTIDLFESQYPVPTGVSYNSYVILDEKTAILDTVDNRATEPWLANLTEALAGRKPDYLVVSHMEPDHGANIARLAALYPEMQVVGNAKTFLYMDQFFGADAVAKERRVVVKDGESLSLGTHTLTFVFAPMVHWPEVMVSYESSEKVLFSADGFGRFGAVARFDKNADWASEARRYYLDHPRQFLRPEQREVRHILLTVDEEQPGCQLETVRPRLLALQAELADEPHRFGELALRHSECPTAMERGRIGVVTPGQLYPELDSRLFALPLGALSPVLRSPMGLHLIQCLDIQEAAPIPMDEALPKIIEQHLLQARQQHQRRWLKSLQRTLDRQLSNH
mgnify:CR=1 FL=1